jgi:putative phosphoesterase
MRLAVLCDIHGNLPALEAVLREVGEANVERVIVGGDVVPGPMARETLAALLALEVPVEFIYGNGEAAVLEAMAGRDYPAVPPEHRPLIRWMAKELYPGFEPVLASWPKTLAVQVAGLGKVLFCHGTPRDENEAFTKLTPEDLLLPVFRVVDSDVVVCGHTHMQFDRMIGETRVVNAGSVGMPFGAPGADWLLLGSGVELRHTDYDLAGAVERICATNYPQADQFAENYVLHPPAEAAMLDAFTYVHFKRQRANS